MKITKDTTIEQLVALVEPQLGLGYAGARIALYRDDGATNKPLLTLSVQTQASISDVNYVAGKYLKEHGALGSISEMPLFIEHAGVVTVDQRKTQYADIAPKVMQILNDRPIVFRRYEPPHGSSSKGVVDFNEKTSKSPIKYPIGDKIEEALMADPAVRSLGDIMISAIEADRGIAFNIGVDAGDSLKIKVGAPGEPSAMILNGEKLAGDARWLENRLTLCADEPSAGVPNRMNGDKPNLATTGQMRGVTQPMPIAYNPATGAMLHEPQDAAMWRNQNPGCAWLYNPWDGKMRDARDIGSDPFGRMTKHPDEKLIVAFNADPAVGWRNPAPDASRDALSPSVVFGAGGGCLDGAIFVATGATGGIAFEVDNGNVTFGYRSASAGGPL